MVLARTALAIGLLAGVAACATILGIEDASRKDDASRDASDDVRGAAAPCVDTSSDSKNCGECGHDCLGGECKAGACMPTVVLEARSLEPAGVTFDGPIAIEDGTVLWLDSSDGEDSVVRHCSALGCVPTRAQQRVRQLPLLARGRFIYKDDFQLMMQALDGGAAEVLFANDRHWILSGVDRASATVFFDVDVGPGAVELQACSFDSSCANRRVVYQRRGVVDIGYAAVSASDAYLVVSSLPPEVVRCPLGGCVPDAGTSIASTLNQPAGIASGKIVGTDENRATIRACTLPDCTDVHVVQIEPSGTAIHEVVTDGVHVYWSTSDNVVARCPIEGCSEKEILMKAIPEDASCSATESCFQAGVAVDAKSVVWTTRDKIYRLALPPR